MNLCILDDVLRTPTHIVVRNNEYVLTRAIPSDCWVYGKTRHPNCVQTLCKIYNNPVPSIYTDTEKRTFEVLGKQPDSVPWIHVLGLDRIKKRIYNISNHLETVLGASSRKLYNEIYLDTRKLLGCLSPAYVCIKTLEKFITTEQNSSLRTCLETFRPLSDQKAKPVIYNQAGTSTGRLTVKSGPSILTLPSRYRSILKSRYKNGSIVSIDFKSLEPRVALSVREKSAPDDIYTHISESILGGKTNRDVAKIATIAALYGISFKKFKEMSKCNDRSVLDRVKDFFAVKIMTKNLAGKEFKNYWGRPLNPNAPEHVRISHFIQSTSCDTVNVGFWNFLKELKKLSIVTTPIFVLHDALILDVPPESFNKISELCKLGIKTPLGIFPTTCEKF